MKIVVALILCFASATWQQNAFWTYPVRRLPVYNQYPDDVSDDLPIMPSQPLFRSFPIASLEQAYSDKHVENGRPFNRALGFRKQKPEVAAADARLFGPLGFSFLASLILQSLSLSTTSTTFVYVTSTFTAGTQTTCYTSTMFSATNYCRRKREKGLYIGNEENLSEVASQQYETINAENSLDTLPREGRDIDPSFLLASSQSEAPLFTRNHGRQDDDYLYTSTITTYSLSMVTYTRTLTNFASTTALLCLPYGMRLC